MARILVTGTDADLRELYAFWLTRTGHHVEVAPARPQDVRSTATEPFDAVVIDCDATSHACGAAVRAIRDLPGHARVPIVMLTADATGRDLEDATQAGVDVILDKPFPLRRLSVLIDQLLSGPATGATAGR
jgi:DNA-binding response OmpR family regulator